MLKQTILSVWLILAVSLPTCANTIEEYCKDATSQRESKLTTVQSGKLLAWPGKRTLRRIKKDLYKRRSYQPDKGGNSSNKNHDTDKNPRQNNNTYNKDKKQNQKAFPVYVWTLVRSTKKYHKPFCSKLKKGDNKDSFSFKGTEAQCKRKGYRTCYTCWK